MNRLLALVALLLSFTASASTHLEGLLAPIALQPDAVIWSILEASRRPHDVMEAAAGRDVDSPAVQALRPHPELLQRMAESPQWLLELGSAYMADPQSVWGTVHLLRQRAQPAPYPAVPQIHSQPVTQIHYWSAPAPHPVFVVTRPVVIYRPVHVHRHVHLHRPNGAPSPAVQMQQQQAVQFRQHHRIPESQRQPIVHSHDGHRKHYEHGGHRKHHEHGHRHHQHRRR